MAGYSRAGPPYPDVPDFASGSSLDVRAKEFVPGGPKSNFRRDRQFNGNRDFAIPNRGGRFYGPPDGGRYNQYHYPQASRPPYQEVEGGPHDRFPANRRPNYNRGRQWTPQQASRDQGARAAMVADTVAFLASTSSNNVPEQGHSEASERQPQRQPNKYYNRSNPSNNFFDPKVKWNGYNNQWRERDRNGGNWSRSRQSNDFESQNDNLEPSSDSCGNSSRGRDYLQNGPDDGENGEHRSRKQNYSFNPDKLQGRSYFSRNNFDKRKNNYDNLSPRNYGSSNNYGPQYNYGGGHSRDSKYDGYGNGRYRQHFVKEGDDASQREKLIEQLTRGALECLVCCDRVRQQDSVWSCSNCFHVLHLRCVIKWAESSKEESGWRCPACQNVTKSVPTQYRCFCGKAADPMWNRQDTPHSCGDVCGKSRETLAHCTHHCLLLCHPGPCPPCAARVTRSCGCGRTSSIVKCSADDDLVCSATCDKNLNCGLHKCTLTCHNDPCPPCDVKIKQDCYCSKQSREVECIPENQGISQFGCGDVCGRTLLCENHECADICHEGPCKECELTPEKVTHCPCGNTELKNKPSHVRKSCTDAIPTCGLTCGKRLACGQPSAPHYCKAKCHTGACPPCDLETLVRCRCGNMDKKIRCVELTTKADDARCGKKCTKKRSCGRHRCNQLCCIEIDHPCPLPCNHLLSCGQHRCEQLCHCGRCRPCWRTSFDELYCYCGAAVLFPPVPCGTKPPPCTKPCTRQHECEHDPLHNCHSEPACPPCTVLTSRSCHGGHEIRKSVPCHQKELSCGRPCNKELCCGRHRCRTNCHKGECLANGQVCTQPCTTLRKSCQHPCNAPCHEGRCPETPCKETVRVSCECGHRAATRVCAENTREYQKIAVSLLASKMDDMQLGLSIDLGDIMGNPATRKLYLKPLECNDECKQIQRNQRLAISLQLRNPDLGAKLTPRYSDSMREWVKKDPAFCQMVHDRLTELVKLAKESKQKSRSYSFKEMNGPKRQFVHEYCEHFGCESMAYDQEPKRNVVATAQRDKAWLPSVSLLELIQREQGQRKVPGPVLSSVKQTSTNRPMESLVPKWPSAKSGPSTSSEPVSYMAAITRNQPPARDSPCPEEAASTYIDYFNS